jgi:hypothetical protein
MLMSASLMNIFVQDERVSENKVHRGHYDEYDKARAFDEMGQRVHFHFGEYGGVIQYGGRRTA